jgi:hypothetical protein
VHKNAVTKPAGWILLAKKRHKFKDNIKMGVTAGYEFGGCVLLIQNRIYWQDFPKKSNVSSGSIKAGNL